MLEPGRAVTPDDLEATAAKQGITVGPGDIVLLRTGRWHKGSSATGSTTEYEDAHDHARWGQVAGWHQACIPWLRDRDVAVIGSDGPQETIPPKYLDALDATVHVMALNSMGMPLIDNCDLEALGTVCAELGRWEFQFIITPLRVVGGSGSPGQPDRGVLMTLPSEVIAWAENECGGKVVDIAEQIRWRPHHFLTIERPTGTIHVVGALATDRNGGRWFRETLRHRARGAGTRGSTG